MALARAVWMAIGAVAILSSLALAIRNPARWKLRVGGQAIAVVLWATFSVNSWAVKTRDVGCCVSINTYPAVGYVAGIISIVLLVDLLFLVLQLLGDESPVEKDPAMGQRR